MKNTKQMGALARRPIWLLASGVALMLFVACALIIDLNRSQPIGVDGVYLKKQSGYTYECKSRGRIVSKNLLHFVVINREEAEAKLGKLKKTEVRSGYTDYTLAPLIGSQYTVWAVRDGKKAYCYGQCDNYGLIGPWSESCKDASEALLALTDRSDACLGFILKFPLALIGMALCLLYYKRRSWYFS